MLVLNSDMFSQQPNFYAAAAYGLPPSQHPQQSLHHPHQQTLSRSPSLPSNATSVTASGRGRGVATGAAASATTTHQGPSERRRLQNRMAQRTYRKNRKLREQEERARREAAANGQSQEPDDRSTAAGERVSSPKSAQQQHQQRTERQFKTEKDDLAIDHRAAPARNQGTTEAQRVRQHRSPSVVSPPRADDSHLLASTTGGSLAQYYGYRSASASLQSQASSATNSYPPSPQSAVVQPKPLTPGGSFVDPSAAGFCTTPPPPSFYMPELEAAYFGGGGEAPAIPNMSISQSPDIAFSPYAAVTAGAEGSIMTAYGLAGQGHPRSAAEDLMIQGTKTLYEPFLPPPMATMSDSPDVLAASPAPMTTMLDVSPSERMVRNPSIDIDLEDALPFQRATSAELLDSSVSVDGPGCSNPLHRAAYYGDEAAARFLMSRGVADPQLRNARGQTSVHVAAEQDHVDMVRLLLLGDSSASSSRFVEIDPELERMDLDIELLNATDAEGRTPLHIAAAGGDPTLVQTLLTLGGVTDGKGGMSQQTVIDINARDSRGATPLRCAAENGRNNVIGILISMGADIHA